MNMDNDKKRPFSPGSSSGEEEDCKKQRMTLACCRCAGFRHTWSSCASVCLRCDDAHLGRLCQIPVSPYPTSGLVKGFASDDNVHIADERGLPIFRSDTTQTSAFTDTFVPVFGKDKAEESFTTGLKFSFTKRSGCSTASVVSEVSFGDEKSALSVINEPAHSAVAVGTGSLPVEPEAQESGTAQAALSAQVDAFLSSIPLPTQRTSVIKELEPGEIDESSVRLFADERAPSRVSAQQVEKPAHAVTAEPAFSAIERARLVSEHRTYLSTVQQESEARETSMWDLSNAVNPERAAMIAAAPLPATTANPASIELDPALGPQRSGSNYLPLGVKRSSFNAPSPYPIGPPRSSLGYSSSRYFTRSYNLSNNNDIGAQGDGREWNNYNGSRRPSVDLPHPPTLFSFDNGVAGQRSVGVAMNPDQAAMMATAPLSSPQPQLKSVNVVQGLGPQRSGSNDIPLGSTAEIPVKVRKVRRGGATRSTYSGSGNKIKTNADVTNIPSGNAAALNAMKGLMTRNIPSNKRVTSVRGQPGQKKADKFFHVERNLRLAVIATDLVKNSDSVTLLTSVNQRLKMAATLLQPIFANDAHELAIDAVTAATQAVQR